MPSVSWISRPPGRGPAQGVEDPGSEHVAAMMARSDRASSGFGFSTTPVTRWRRPRLSDTVAQP